MTSSSNDDELRQQVKLVTADPIKYVTNVNRQIVKLESKNAALESLTCDLFKQLAEANTKLKTMETDLQTEQTDVSSRKRSRTEASELLAKLTEKDKQIAYFRKDLAQGKKQIVGLESDLTERNKQIVNCQIEMVRKDKKFNEIWTEIVSKSKQVADLRAEVTEKNDQIDKFQSEATLLNKQVNAFDDFFQVFIDKLRSTFNNFFATSGGLSEEDSVAINNFIANLTEQKQKIMNIGFEDVEDTLATNFISDDMLLSEFEALCETNAVDELNWFVCKLKGLLYTEDIKRRLFEAKSLHKDKSEIVRISSFVVQFAEDMINKSKGDIVQIDLEELQNRLYDVYNKLKIERALIKQFEDKIALSEKEDALAVLSEHTVNAANKLVQCAELISKQQCKRALELLFIGIGMCLPTYTNVEILKRAWRTIIYCYEDLGLHRKVVSLCTELIKQVPRLSLFHFLRGRAYYQLQEYGHALVDIKRALELEPGHKDALKLKNYIERRDSHCP